MLNVVFRPIGEWPGKKREHWQRKSTPFAATFTQTLDLLEAELGHLKAKDIVIQAETDMSQIRNDGWMKSNARVDGPAVILTFESRGSVYSYPCDTFTHWHANLRAIALSLEALRKVDRYGVTSNNEQYQGFKRLAAADPAAERNAALEVLARISGIFLSGAPTAETIDLAYKSAAFRCHPDRGGDGTDWAQLQAAMSILRPARQMGGTAQ